jgi:malate dehydrogenase (oxaloacetate-decarboxylating)
VVAAPRCFEIEERLRKELSIPVMHDDQWGTATVVLGGVINVLTLLKKEKEEVKVVINGIGSAGVAVSRLLLEYGIKDSIFCDSKGIIHQGRTDLTKEKLELLARSSAVPSEGTLADAVKGRDIFIGLSKPGTLTQDMVRSMGEKPVIFSLANPIPEIMPEEAHEAGAFIVATGRSDYPNQLNNSLIFPGLFKGMLQYRVKQFSNEIFIRAGIALAHHVESPTVDAILPSMFDKDLVDVIADVVKPE